MVDWYDAAGRLRGGGQAPLLGERVGARLRGAGQAALSRTAGSAIPSQCNIDNPYVRPDLDRVYSPKADVQDAEL